MKRIQASMMLILLAGIAACSTTSGPALTGMSLSKQPLTGKFIWHDLISTNLEADKRFYNGLFGWEYEQSKGPRGKVYTLAKSSGHYVAGIVSEQKPADGADISRWLGYLSVTDVDAAVGKNAADGGETAVEPLEISDFVRVAAIIDPQGAVLGLAQSYIGDPDDSVAAGPDRIVWDELLAADTGKAADYYRSLAGYDIKTIDRHGGQYTLLLANGIKRAGILANPLEGVEPLWLTYFAVPDVKAAAAKVAGLGGRVLLAPAADARDGKLALVVDPSGALLALQQWPM